MRSIKNVGLVVLAALALMGMVGAASASASGFEADKYPAAIEGSPAEEQYEQYLWVGDFGMGCSGSALKGSLEYPTETISATPADATCTYFGSWPLKANGCKLTFQPGSETSPGTFSGTVAIGPSGCGPITLTMKSKCIVEIGAQSGLKATYQNVGSGSTATVSVDMEATGLEYTQTHLSGAGCKSGTYSNGKWSAAWSLKASKNGSQVGLRAANKLPALIAIEGEESEVEAEQPQLEAEKYPVALTGEQDPYAPHTFGFKIGTAYCESATFSSEIFGPTAEFSLQAQYSGNCVAVGFGNATVSMSGCSYAFHILNVGPPYQGDADIVCPEGKAIEIKAKLGSVTKCTITIPAQSGLEGIAFQNTEWGFVVRADIKLSGIKYHQQEGTGLGRCSSGDFSDGTYAGTIPFQGFS